MLPPLPPSGPRQRSASCSIEDQSPIKDRPRRLFQRHYAHDISVSSQSLDSTYSHHDDLPTPLLPPHASHTTSAQSTPMTSPSTGYSSLFPGSLSSATSESAPVTDSKYRCEFGMLMPGSSSTYSAVHGSAPSRSSNPVSRVWSRSPTELDPQSSAPRVPRKRPSDHLPNRPLTAPNSPLTLSASSSIVNSPADQHSRSHSRLTVSIKNLFTRRAVPSPSRLSLNSASTPPESEASSSSFHVPGPSGKWSMTPRKSRPPDLEISGSVAPAIPSPGCTSDSPIDVHRRYASEAAAKIYNNRIGSTGSASQEGIDVSPRNVPSVRGKDPKTRNVLRRRPSGSAKLFKARERGMSTSSRPNLGDADHPHPPPKDAMSRQGDVSLPLTPASAVVEAYKQQELYRDDTPSPPKLSIDDRMSSTASYDGHHGHGCMDHSPTPYYTVFGASSERRLPAGGPDDQWGGFEVDQRIFSSSQHTLSHQPSMSDPGGRGLTRKLSNRWRKGKGGSVAADDSPLRDKGHSKGRPSLQEIWRNDKSNSRPTGRSMDVVSNPADGAWASPSASHTRSPSKGDKNEGPKLWRLVRRISTGALRDRSQSDKAVPPVPAIPQGFLTKLNQTKHDDDLASTLRHQPSSSLRDKNQSRPSTATRNGAVARPSVASSSSPNSSDVASTLFFQKSHSPRSSVSSYGEAVVVTHASEAPLDLHIIAPLEQLRLADDHVKNGETNRSSLPVSRSPRRSTSVPAGLRTVENAEGDRLPLPPSRRQTCSGESPSSGSSRPCSTCPSTSGSARASYQNAAGGQSRMADGTVSLSPPPRASAKTSARGSSVASSPSHSMVVKQVDGGVGLGNGGARHIDRTPSGQSDMTARLDSPRSAQGRDQEWNEDASPHIRTAPTFRELGGPRRPPLSEREKTDIWNDLLARSDRAGGTLHINGATELMSDSMRLSTHSDDVSSLDQT